MLNAENLNLLYLPTFQNIILDFYYYYSGRILDQIGLIFLVLIEAQLALPVTPHLPNHIVLIAFLEVIWGVAHKC